MRTPFDLIVLGSGAAGLTAAVVAASEGARVAVYEKHDLIGGTTAWSGGQLWIPNNPYMSSVGTEDTDEAAVTYVMSLSRGLLDEAMVRAYVRDGRRMVEYMDKHAAMEFYALPGFPDYHAEKPGGRPDGGRTIECPPFPFAELGDWAARVTPSPYYPSNITMAETTIGTRFPQPVAVAEIERRKVRNERGMGQSLVGRLLKACLELNVTVQTSSRARELIVEDGRVVGVMIERSEGLVEVRAHKGVVLATGGFDFNEEYKKAFLRGPLTHSVAIESNTGDGLYMAMKVGAQLGNMREAFWSTIGEVPEGVNSKNRVLLSGDRTRPRSIIVNRHGKRFANEAANYNMFSGAFFEEDTFRFEYRNLPCWLIFDHEYVRRFGTVGQPPGEPPAWLESSPTLEALAQRLGIPAASLRDTVGTWNNSAAEGVDHEFHRGEGAHDRWSGDPNAKQTVEGTIGPLDSPPYYAIPVHVGAVGTKGGPRTDEDARVLDLDGHPIPGLYAAGNAMASVFGMCYPGGGATLGPAMVYGYVAGRHVGQQLVTAEAGAGR